MVAVLEGGATRKGNLGAVLLAIGGFALFLELSALWLQAGAVVVHGTTDCLGLIGSVGLALLKVANFIAWNPNGILLTLTRVLLLCWPVAVMFAGVVLSRGR